MIVLDRGDDWQVVLQPEHAELSEEVARAWADVGPRHDSVVLASRRHDDGWATWERSPTVHDDGAPVSFLDIHVPAHIAFYRAGIAAVTDEDAYAGLLVSMHGAGIYRQRYGADPGLKVTRAPEAQQLVDAFVAEQEGSYESGWPRQGSTTRSGSRATTCSSGPTASPSPSACGGGTSRVSRSRSASTASSPWGRGGRVSRPGRSARPELECSLVRRLVPKRSWRQSEFREAFFALPAERVTVGFVE